MRENRMDVARSTRNFFIRVLEGHTAVMDIMQLDRDLYLIKRTGGRTDVKVYIADIYIAGEGDVLEIASEHPDIDCIVLVGFYNRYPSIAKASARSRNIGLYDIREFFGALNFVGDAFLNYTKKN